MEHSGLRLDDRQAQVLVYRVGSAPSPFNPLPENLFRRRQHEFEDVALEPVDGEEEALSRRDPDPIEIDLRRLGARPFAVGLVAALLVGCVSALLVRAGWWGVFL